MGEFDNFARLCSLVEAHLSQTAEPTTCPMSTNEMLQVAPNTYNFCNICGIPGHFDYECSYYIYNAQGAQFGQVNDYRERYESNPYSNAYDQDWTGQPNFSYTGNNFQNFSYHDQQQFQQQQYEEQYHDQQQFEQSSWQQYEYPPLQNFQVHRTNENVQPDQMSDMMKILIQMQKDQEEFMQITNELKTRSKMMEAKISELASSSTAWQPDSTPPPSIPPEDEMDSIILTSDQEKNSSSMCVDDVLIEIEEELSTDVKINDFVIVEDVVSMDENMCFKVDVMSKIVQEDLSPILLDNPFQTALTLQFSEEGDPDNYSLFIDSKSQEDQIAPETVRNGEEPPPEPPPYVNIKGVRRFRGCEFYRCFITKFSKTTYFLDQLLFIDVVAKFANACLETLCRIKTTVYALDFVRGGPAQQVFGVYGVALHASTFSASTLH